MSLRCCPKCNSELGSSDHYFCSTCGFVLPSSLISTEVPLKSKSFRSGLIGGKATAQLQKFKSSRLHLVVNKKNIKYYLLAIVLFVLGIFAGNIATFIFSTITVTQSPKGGKSVATSPSTDASKNVIDSTVALTSGALIPNKMADYIPSKIDLYVLIPDSKSFVSLMSPELNIDPTTVGAYTSLISGPIAFYSAHVDGTQVWAVLTTVREKNLVAAILKDKSFGDLKLTLIDDVLIATPSDTALKMTEESINNYALTLNQNPAFISAKTALTSQGKILIMSFNSDGIKLLEEVKPQLKDTVLADLIDQFIISGYNEVVVK